MQEIPTGTIRRGPPSDDFEQRMAALDAPATADASGAHSAAPVEAEAQSPLVLAMQPYLQQAAKVEAAQPVVAHYLRVHIVEQLLRAKKRGELDAQARGLLLATLEEAEAKKAALDLASGPQQMEAHARRIFRAAVDADAVGAAAPELLEAAGLLAEALAQFSGGELPAALRPVLLYAHARAQHLRERLRAGAPPEAPAPPAFPEPPAPPAAAPPVAPAPAAAPQARQPPPAAQPTAPPEPPGHRTAPLGGAEAAADAAAAAAAARVAAALAAAAAPPAAAAAQCAAPSPYAGMPPTQRKSEAKKRVDSAVSALAGSGDDTTKARALVVEALQLLEGLS